MARIISPNVQTVLSADVVRPLGFAELVLNSGTTRVNSTDRDITFNGNVFMGVGNMGKVSPITESVDLSASGVRMHLSGIKEEHINMVLSEKYQGRPCRIWKGFLDDDYQLIADPVLLFEGMLDQMGIEYGKEVTVTVSAENKLIRWERPKLRRFTNADQQERYPGDLGLEFVSQMVEKEILWGSKGTKD